MKLALLFAVLALPVTLAAAQDVPSARAGAADADQRALELEKLQLEIAALKRSPWLTALFGLLGGLVGGALSTTTALVVSHGTRKGALDQAVHEKRIAAYPELVQAAAPLAIYFPSYESESRSIQPSDCVQMGRTMVDWYFRAGGLLLSTEARTAYFAFGRALTRASTEDDLRAPVFPRDAQLIDEDILRTYRTHLRIVNAADVVDTWPFGEPAAESDPPAVRFRDYVLLQALSSELRRQLAEDLGSRRRPGTESKEAAGH